jgi:hypothetical protein
MKKKQNGDHQHEDEHKLRFGYPVIDNKVPVLSINWYIQPKLDITGCVMLAIIKNHPDIKSLVGISYASKSGGERSIRVENEAEFLDHVRATKEYKSYASLMALGNQGISPRYKGARHYGHSIRKQE